MTDRFNISWPALTKFARAIAAALPSHNASPSGSPRVDDEIIESESDVVAPAAPCDPSIELSPRRHMLISEIVTRTPSATYAFLQRFTDVQLERYMAHLDYRDSPKSRGSGWLRAGDTPAITGAAAMM